MISCPPKKIEIFTGTGGVGKTTLATSRAVYLSSLGKKVLLITIDPSKRLKQVLNLDDKDSGHLQTVSLKPFLGDASHISMSALLLSPAVTLQKIGNNDQIDNPILNTLSKPYGGLNEIMAMVELYHQLQSGAFDHIVLDTPPGKHFIDFLDSGKKIHDFFDSSFVDIFKVFGRTIENRGEAVKSSRILSTFVAAGVKKLLKYLEKVTGKDFVETFVSAILAIYSCKNAFLDSLKLQEELQDHELTNLFLVTSVEHNKLREAEEMHQKMQQTMQCDNYLAINRCLAKELHKWLPNPDSPLFQVKVSMLERENKLKSYAKDKFKNILEFPDVIETSPETHVSHLVNSWPKES